MKELQGRDQVMADDRDQPGFYMIRPLQLLVLDLQLPRLLGDLPFQPALPPPEMPGAYPDNDHHRTYQQTKPQQPRPGLLIPLRGYPEAAFFMGVVRLSKSPLLAQQQPVITGGQVAKGQTRMTDIHGLPLP